MKKIVGILLLAAVLLASGYAVHIITQKENSEVRFVDYTVSADKITLFYRNAEGKRYGSLDALKQQLEGQGKQLVFAMNGGMYTPQNKPQGLYMESGKEIAPLDTGSGGGNFYMKPNGVFYITEMGKAGISATGNFVAAGVKYATQSGPMLLVDGKVHPAFKQNSANLNIRNGVGVLADGSVLFSISPGQVNFYDFAMHFKEKGCQNALYLDGFVSRIYYPGKGLNDTAGNFGVIVGVVE